MSNGNPLTPISKNLNVFLRENSLVTLSDTIPAAPEGATNVQWQMDQFGNISASTTGGGLVLTLETNGVANGSQSLLNLVAGNGITLVDNGTGMVTVTGEVSAGPEFSLQASNGAGGFITSGGGVTAATWNGDINVIGGSVNAGSNLSAGGTIFFGTSISNDAGTATIDSSGNATFATLALTTPTITSSATAGSASALPAAPLGYLSLAGAGGTTVKIPIYAA